MSGQPLALVISHKLCALYGCIERDTPRIGFDTAAEPRRMLKTSSLLGRNERKAEAYSEYVEALSEVRTKLAVVFNSFPIRRPRLPRPTPPVASVLPLRYAGACGQTSNRANLFPASRLEEWRSCLP
jgi:hypothetical protein